MPARRDDASGDGHARHETPTERLDRHARAEMVRVAHRAAIAGLGLLALGLRHRLAAEGDA